MPEAYTEDQVIDALYGSGGTIHGASVLLGCDWHTVKRYMDEYPSVKEAYEAARGSMDDEMESRWLRILRDEGHPDQARQLWNYMRTKGSMRGYGEKLDVTSKGESINAVRIIRGSDDGGTDDT